MVTMTHLIKLLEGRQQLGASPKWRAQEPNDNDIDPERIGMTMTSATTINSCRHEFVAYLSSGGVTRTSGCAGTSSSFLANSRQTVRVMATLTCIDDLPADDLPLLKVLCPPDDYDHAIMSSGTAMTTTPKTTMKVITLDDGTGSICGVWCSEHFLTGSNSNSNSKGSADDINNDGDNDQDDVDDGSMNNGENGRVDKKRRSVEVGTTIDCILKLRQSSSIKRWVVDCIIVVDDPLIDEPLRWITISLFHQQQQQSSDSGSAGANSIDYSCGFPTYRQDTPAEVYRMICVQSKIFNSDSCSCNSTTGSSKNRARELLVSSNRNNNNNNNNRNRRCSVGPISSRSCSTITTPSPATPAVKPQPLVGVSFDDLALVLQIPSGELQNIIEALQLQGQIYQNEKGEFLPL